MHVILQWTPPVALCRRFRTRVWRRYRCGLRRQTGSGIGSIGPGSRVALTSAELAQPRCRCKRESAVERVSRPARDEEAVDRRSLQISSVPRLQIAMTRCPTGQVMRQHRRPARRRWRRNGLVEMIGRTHVLEHSGILDLCVAMVGRQLQAGSPSQSVMASSISAKGPAGISRQSGFTSPDECRTGAASGLHLLRQCKRFRPRRIGRCSATFGRSVRLGYGFNEIAHTGPWQHGDGEADLRLATDGDHGKPLSARTVSCPLAPAWRTRPTVSCYEAAR